MVAATALSEPKQETALAGFSLPLGLSKTLPFQPLKKSENEGSPGSLPNASL